MHTPRNLFLAGITCAAVGLGAGEPAKAELIAYWSLDDAIGAGNIPPDIGESDFLVGGWGGSERYSNNPGHVMELNAMLGIAGLSGGASRIGAL